MALRNPGTQWFLIGWIVLMGVQLTGLSCLNEWRIDPSEDAVLSPQPFNGPDGTGEPTNDGCPCHLKFTATYRIHLHNALLSSPEKPAALLAFVSVLGASLFRPPTLQRLRPRRPVRRHQ